MKETVGFTEWLQVTTGKLHQSTLDWMGLLADICILWISAVQAWVSAFANENLSDKNFKFLHTLNTQKRCDNAQWKKTF